MTTNPFAAPAPAAGGVTWETLNGSLLIIEPNGVEEDIQTVHGPATAVRATVHVVDGTTAGEVHADTLVFPKVLIGQLRSKIGQRVLGRLGQGNKKPGQSAPWVLQEATPADIQAGTEYLTRYQSGQFTTPAADAAAPPF